MKFSVHNLLFLLFFISACHSSRKSYQSASLRPLGESMWNESNISAFENEIEFLRQKYHIPGLSAGIVNKNKLIWKKGFGYADIENKMVPDENTVYQIASVSKTFGSILLMQEAESGKLSLDDPINIYGIELGGRWGSDPRIKLKHLLTHTASGNSLNGFKPGYTFRYNGDWYNQLKKAIEKSSAQTYGELFMKNIVTPLRLKNTVPSISDTSSFSLTGYDMNIFRKKIAKPYNWEKGKMTPINNFYYGFGPAAGIMSCISDLAQYSMAIDEKKFLKPQTWEKVFTPFVTPKGKKIHYGLGWFVRYYHGKKIVWHTGWWTGYSALLIKIPDNDLTFIILANSQDLSRPFYHIVQLFPGFAFINPFHKNLNNTLLGSAFGKSFIKHFSEIK